MASRKLGKAPRLAFAGVTLQTELPFASPAGMTVEAECIACGDKARVVMEWPELWILLDHGRLWSSEEWSYSHKDQCAQVTLRCVQCGVPVVTKLTPKLMKFARRSGKKFR